MDEKEVLKAQIKAYEFYAGLIERAVGAGQQAKLPRWDEQRAMEYRELATQLRARLTEIEAEEAAGAQAASASPAAAAAAPETPVASTPNSPAESPARG